MTYQRGDRVAATNTVFRMNGTVERTKNYMNLVLVRWDSRPALMGFTIPAFSEWVHPSHLRLLSREVSQATFSKGDVVEITSAHPNPAYRGALGVVARVLQDRPEHHPRYQVKPYGPSKPFEQLSPGPFTYRANELKARKANGLVPVNFVREAMGLPKFASGGVVPPPPGVRPWTRVGLTDDGASIFTAPVGSAPPTTRHGGTVSIDIAPSAAAKAWLEALSQPTAIKISEAMRRRGITSEDAVTGLERRADNYEALAGRQKSTLKRQGAALHEIRAERDAAESRARDLADQRDRLRDQLAASRRQAQFNADAHTSSAARLRGEIEHLKADLAVSRQQRSFQDYQELADSNRELMRQRDSAQEAAREARARIARLKQTLSSIHQHTRGY